MLDELKEEKNSVDSERLVYIKFDGTIFDFNVFKSSLDFASNIYNGKISLKKAKNSQYKMLKLLNGLKDYNPTNPDKIKYKEETLINPKKLYKNKNNVIKAFEDGVFPFKDGFKKKSQTCLIKHCQIG